MLIRKSTEADIPAIVALLKKSLGETSSPKTVDYWVWKHINNPFGESMVLVSDNNGQLIGVRAMMRWCMQEGVDAQYCLRAVDTVTHPDYQGRGIFSILTQKIVARAHNEGIDFIFNNALLIPSSSVDGKIPIVFSLRASPISVAIFSSSLLLCNGLPNLELLQDSCNAFTDLFASVPSQL